MYHARSQTCTELKELHFHNTHDYEAIPLVFIGSEVSELRPKTRNIEPKQDPTFSEHRVAHPFLSGSNFRWFVLLMLLMVPFGIYWSFDVPGAIETQLGCFLSFVFLVVFISFMLFVLFPFFFFFLYCSFYSPKGPFFYRFSLFFLLISPCQRSFVSSLLSLLFNFSSFFFF